MPKRAKQTERSRAVEWGKRPSKKAPAGSTLDSFVNQGKPTKRLNADIPSDLHAHVKSQCALLGREMKDVLIELLEQRFPRK